MFFSRIVTSAFVCVNVFINILGISYFAFQKLDTTRTQEERAVAMMGEVEEFAKSLSYMQATLPYDQQMHYRKVTVKARRILNRCLDNVDDVLAKTKIKLKTEGSTKSESDGDTEHVVPDSTCPSYICAFCQKSHTQLYRHFETVHINEPDVQAYLAANGEAKTQLRRELLYRGNFLFSNLRPKSDRKHGTRICHLCHKTISKQSLARHIRTLHAGSSRRNISSCNILYNFYFIIKYISLHVMKNDNSLC